MITINGEENDVKEPQSPSLLHKSKSLLHSKYEILIKYTLVPSVPLSIIAILSINPNTWMTSEIHHFYIELIAVILAASVAISSLFLVFPASVIDNYSIHRPYEIPSLVLFVIALFYFYKNELYKRTDTFYKGILGYLIVDIFSQIIMSYSAISFDTAHNVAHVLKDAGYFINIIALALSSIQYNSELREINQRLKESNERLREREEVIHVQYERLKESDMMKNEFINVAAHELRTPIQPILSLTEALRSQIKEPQQQELADVTIRNAKRLKRLTDDILDVTKIESHSLNLKKELFNLNDVLTNAVDDITANMVSNNNNNNNNNNKKGQDIVKLVYQPRDI